ncbi:hypothetical protein Tco_0988003 [Tanacetum coccineum]|uniref:Uncharacterized protein n=1 Tax=Tanacetum coccineum TaxID=301880 RepID=A0ABQ5EQ47_9ASTR
MTDCVTGYAVIDATQRKHVKHDIKCAAYVISGLGQTMNAEVDIGLDGGRDKPLRPADVLLYSLDGGLDVCVCGSDWIFTLDANRDG